MGRESLTTAILANLLFPYTTLFRSDPGIEPGSPALQVDSLPTALSGKLCAVWYWETDVCLDDPANYANCLAVSHCSLKAG